MAILGFVGRQAREDLPLRRSRKQRLFANNGTNRAKLTKDSGSTGDMTDTAPEIKVTLTAEDRGVAAAIKELGNQLSQLKQKQQEVAESSILLKNAFDAVIPSAVILKVVEFGQEVLQTSSTSIDSPWAKIGPSPRSAQALKERVLTIS